MTRRPINYLDRATAQSGAPVTVDTIREGCLNTFLVPLRWVRDQLQKLTWRDALAVFAFVVFLLWLVTNR